MKIKIKDRLIPELYDLYGEGMEKELKFLINDFLKFLIKESNKCECYGTSDCCKDCPL